MKITIEGSKPFQCLKNTMTIGPSTEGYVLMYGAVKDQLTAYETSTPANENLIVNGCTPLSWFCLSGNTGNVIAIV